MEDKLIYQNICLEKLLLCWQINFRFY